MQILNEKDLTLYKKFIVTSADTDMFGRLRLSGLVNYLIQSAISSADNLGFGLRFLKEEQLFWVLSRFEVNIKQELKWYDEVIVETWPKTSDGIFYIRDFIVRDKNENIVAKASSSWLAIDTLRKRPKVISGYISETFHALSHKQSIEHFPEKLKYVADGEMNEIQTTFFDTDLNKHVTTTRYIDWMMDDFPVDFHEKHYPTSLTINFIKETMPNEKMKIFKNQLAENIFHFEGLNVASEKQAFRGIITF
ncbi:MAG: hypothetical protein JXL97_16145 [Bacteroidales bacterium]|nr:hypothetical protein [Bacteroidales bacterium]